MDLRKFKGKVTCYWNMTMEHEGHLNIYLVSDVSSFTDKVANENKAQ